MHHGATAPVDTELVRSLVLREILAGMEQPVTLPALAERSDAPVSRTYRMLRALQYEGFVDHVGRQGHRLGARSLGLGALLGPWPELRAPARPVLVRLPGRTSLSARLHVRSGHDRVLLLAAVPPHDQDPSHRNGRAGRPGAGGQVAASRSASSRHTSSRVASPAATAGRCRAPARTAATTRRIGTGGVPIRIRRVS